jgi:hypothetical protein
MKCTHTKIFVNYFLHFYENILRKIIKNSVPGKNIFKRFSRMVGAGVVKKEFINRAGRNGCRHESLVEYALATDEGSETACVLFTIQRLFHDLNVREG